MTDREISARSYRDIIDAINGGDTPMGEIGVEYVYEPDSPECEGWACGNVVGYDPLCERVLLNLDNSEDWVTNAGYWLYSDGSIEYIGMGSWGGCPSSVVSAYGRRTYEEDGCIVY